MSQEPSSQEATQEDNKEAEKSQDESVESKSVDESKEGGFDKSQDEETIEYTQSVDLNDGGDSTPTAPSTPSTDSNSVGNLNDLTPQIKTSNSQTDQTSVDSSSETNHQRLNEENLNAPPTPYAHNKDSVNVTYRDEATSITVTTPTESFLKQLKESRSVAAFILSKLKELEKKSEAGIFKAVGNWVFGSSGGKMEAVHVDDFLNNLKAWMNSIRSKDDIYLITYLYLKIKNLVHLYPLGGYQPDLQFIEQAITTITNSTKGELLLKYEFKTNDFSTQGLKDLIFNAIHSPRSSSMFEPILYQSLFVIWLSLMKLHENHGTLTDSWKNYWNENYPRSTQFQLLPNEVWSACIHHTKINHENLLKPMLPSSYEQM
eukprot:TRINITY_DN663_c0_g1_i1.p1 TRINITY_DN663_c0_g1~~TRINITY_DN663_c0_g1_i1.p1  ORF type:complete len:374 (+),score=37.26 TRINITY_DN663_c0_g1_i1:54-1175(+)